MPSAVLDALSVRVAQWAIGVAFNAVLAELNVVVTELNATKVSFDEKL